MIIDIVLICGDGRGGLEKVITLISKELELRGYRVRVIQIFKPLFSEWKETINEFYCLNNFYHNSDYPIESMVSDYKEFILENEKPDIVIATHVPTSTLICYESLKACELIYGIPIISWIHGPVWVYGKNSRKYLNNADAHLAISDEIYKQLEDINDEKNVYLINNPVDINNKFVLRSDDTLELTFIGRLAKEKRVEILLRGLENVKGNWTLDIYGDGEEGQFLKEMAVTLGISEKITWHGWVNNPWEKIKSSSLLVITSEQEGFGLVVVEALSRGIPILSTKTEGPSRIVEDSVTGWLVDIDDYSAINNILTKIMTKEIELPSQKICRNSVKKFDVKGIVDNFEKSILIEYARKKIRK